MASDLSVYPRFVLLGSLHQDSFIDAGAGMDERLTAPLALVRR
ncbi:MULTISPECIES: hypothetical protein [unclassified Streptomyces]